MRNTQIVTSFTVALLCAAGSLPAGAQQRASTPDRASAEATRSGQDVFLTIGRLNKTDAGSAPLHWAAQANDLGQVQQLIRAGANVNVTNRYGVTPLLIAAENGNPAIVSALVKAGADANTVRGDGETVLMRAARTGNTPVVKELLAAGANPNAREGWFGQTALMWAAGKSQASTVAELLKHGADPAIAGTILAHHDVEPPPGTPKVIVPKGGMTALHYAARAGALEALKVLASDPRVNLNEADPDGLTALHYAALNVHYDVVAFLIEKGANLNLQDVYGRTAMSIAVDQNRPEWDPVRVPLPTGGTSALDLVRIALSNGGNPNTRITKTPPGRCWFSCSSAWSAGATPLWRAARANDSEMVRLLLASGADPMATSGDGVNAVMAAAGQLWKHSQEGAPLRSVGTQTESIETIKLLLAAGVDVNEANIRGETALHGAANRGAEAVARFLVENGADLTVKDESNRTPLHVAMGIKPHKQAYTGIVEIPPDRESTVQVLRNLMTAKEVPIETHTPRPQSTEARVQ